MDGYTHGIPAQPGRTGCGLALGSDFLTNASSDKFTFAAELEVAPSKDTASCQVHIMDFLDDDDEFLRGLPSLTDWCPSPRNNARQHLPGASTAPNSTLLPSFAETASDLFGALGPWALSAPSARGQGMLSSGGNCLQRPEKLSRREMVSPTAHVEWSASVPAMLSGNSHSGMGALSIALPVQSQPPQPPQGQAQAQQEPKWCSAPAASPVIPMGLPWPWNQCTPPDAPAGLALHQHHLAAARTDPRSGRLPLSGLSQQQQLLLLQQQEQQQKQQLQHQRLLHQLPFPQQQQQQPASSLCLLGAQSTEEADRLLAEILAAPWPSSKGSTYDPLTASAFQDVSALGEGRLPSQAAAAGGAMATATAPQPSLEVSSACGTANGAAAQPVSGSVPLPATMYGSLGAVAGPLASAPPTPVLSPPAPPDNCPLGRRVQSVGETGLAAGDSSLLPPRSTSAPDAKLRGCCLLHPEPMPAAPAPAASVVAVACSSSARVLPAGRPLPLSVRCVETAPMRPVVAALAPAVACARQPPSTEAARNLGVVAADASCEDPMHVQVSDGGKHAATEEDDGSDDCDGFGGGAGTAAGGASGSTGGAGAGGAESSRRGGGGRAGGSGRAGSRVTLEALRSMFDLPVQEVVRALGISATDLKRRCRALGIQRWPQRKLMSLRRLAEAVETDKDLTEEERREMLERVARNRAEILADPDAELEACLKPVRQQHYKRNFVDRRSAARS